MSTALLGAATTVAPASPKPLYQPQLRAGVAPTLLSQLCFLLGDPAYVLLVLGYAAYTFTIIGISSFGPQFFLGVT